MKALKIITVLSFIAAISATGCSNSNTGIKVDTGDIKVNADVDVDTGNVTVDADTGDIKIGDLSVNIDDILKYDKSHKAKADFSFDTDKSIKAFEINLSVGNVIIEPSDSDKTTLDLEYTIFAETDAVCEQVEGIVSAESEVSGDTMTLKLVEKNSGEEINHWLEKNIPECRVEYTANVTVPDFVEKFTADCDVSNITFSNISGSVNGYVNVGNITCTAVEFTASSEIKANTGNIAMTDANIYNADTEISAVAGNIVIALPDSKSEDGNIKISVETGDVKFKGNEPYNITEDEKDSKKLEVNSCNIEASVNTGNITIE
ncbi:MAG: hypothetical protein IJB68_09315 [Ruminococcus sp.]|nr:hypothetical protein [Ruminococcus sp.]